MKQLNVCARASVKYEQNIFYILIYATHNRAKKNKLRGERESMKNGAEKKNIIERKKLEIVVSELPSYQLIFRCRFVFFFSSFSHRTTMFAMKKLFKANWALAENIQSAL